MSSSARTFEDPDPDAEVERAAEHEATAMYYNLYIKDRGPNKRKIKPKNFDDFQSLLEVTAVVNFSSAAAAAAATLDDALSDPDFAPGEENNNNDNDDGFKKNGAKRRKTAASERERRSKKTKSSTSLANGNVDCDGSDFSGSTSALMSNAPMSSSERRRLLLERDKEDDMLDDAAFLQKWRKDQPEICCVCLDEFGGPGNDLVFCDGQDCDVVVHQECYGIQELPKESDPWYCDRCLAKPGEVVTCLLCPDVIGAFKRTFDNQAWCHVACVMWIPEAGMIDTDRLEGADVRDIPARRFQTVCCLCPENSNIAKEGATIKCEAGMCRNNFHVTCGLNWGLLEEEEIKTKSSRSKNKSSKLKSTDHEDEGDDDDDNDETKDEDFPFYAYCKDHGSKASPRLNPWYKWSMRLQNRKHRRQRRNMRFLASPFDNDAVVSRRESLHRYQSAITAICDENLLQIGALQRQITKNCAILNTNMDQIKHLRASESKLVRLTRQASTRLQSLHDELNGIGELVWRLHSHLPGGIPGLAKSSSTSSTANSSSSSSSSKEFILGTAVSRETILEALVALLAAQEASHHPVLSKRRLSVLNSSNPDSIAIQTTADSPLTDASDNVAPQSPASTTSSSSSTKRIRRISRSARESGLKTFSALYGSAGVATPITSNISAFMEGSSSVPSKVAPSSSSASVVASESSAPSLVASSSASVDGNKLWSSSIAYAVDASILCSLCLRIEVPNERKVELTKTIDHNSNNSDDDDQIDDEDDPSINKTHFLTAETVARVGSAAVQCGRCHARFHCLCLNPPMTKALGKGFAWLCEYCDRQWTATKQSDTLLV